MGILTHSEKIIEVAPDFWNIRGSFKIGGALDIGTHASLAKLRNGKFVLLDAYTFSDKIRTKINELTDQGKDLEAIINLHPFHTVHVTNCHQQFPKAKLYGTKRHHEKFPELPWETDVTESAKFARRYKADIEFTVPKGVHFVAKNENLHFASVLAYHIASKTIHVDDTLTLFRLPGLTGMLQKPAIRFHPTLGFTLEKRSGAAKDFRTWAKQMMHDWKAAENLCAAHSDTILASKNKSKSIHDQIMTALNKVEKTLRTHEQKNA